MHSKDFAAAFTAVHYSRDHHDVNSLAAALPFAATRASDNGVLHPHRAALADALWEAGRDDEAQIAADPSKHVVPIPHGHEEGWGVAEHDSSGRGYDWLNRPARQYLETALWASTGDDGVDGVETYPLDERHSVSDFTDEATHRAKHDYSKFLGKLSPAARAEIEDDDRHTDAAHDLFLTRNGHGAGFWDGDWEHGDELTEAAKSLGEQYVEVDPQPNGDATDADGVQLHLSGGRE